MKRESEHFVLFYATSTFFSPNFPHAKLHHYSTILTFKRTQQEEQKSRTFQRRVQIRKTVLNKDYVNRQ